MVLPPVQRKKPSVQRAALQKALDRFKRRKVRIQLYGRYYKTPKKKKKYFTESDFESVDSSLESEETEYNVDQALRKEKREQIRLEDQYERKIAR